NALTVAVDVCAELQDGCAAVATGERHHVRLGRQARDLDRAPREPLDAQPDADFLGHRRGRIVMQNDLVHAVLLCTWRASVAPARGNESMRLWPRRHAEQNAQ